MPIGIGSNIDSLAAQRHLDATARELTSIFERLSSGQRINRPADDAAGLAVADSLRTRSRVFNRGYLNISDGISMMSLADNQLDSLTSITQRLVELAEQAANGSYSRTQRAALDTEAQTLQREFTRLLGATRFNNLAVLGGGVQDLRIQAGYGEAGSVLSALGNHLGSGSFGAATYNDAESTSSSDVAYADLNGDGIVDLVSGGQSTGVGQVTVRLGYGDGTFGKAAVYTSEGGITYGVALGDFNNDGIVDLVSAGRTGLLGVGTVRLGNGDGTFGAAAGFSTTGSGSTDVAIGDLNRDGNLDLVITGSTTGVGASVVKLGNGNGTFGSNVSYSMDASGSGSGALADLNQDGILDLVTQAVGGANTISVRLGLGDGTFDSKHSINGVSNPTAANSLALGDVNGDGVPDIVATNGASIAVVLNLGNGTFSSVSNFSGTYLAMKALTLADVNGDGNLDIGVGASITGGHNTGIFLGNGDGTFTSATTSITTFNGISAVGLADINGDGVLDFIADGTYAGGGQVATQLGGTREGSNPILKFSLATQSDARQALPLLQRKLELLSQQRGTIGASLARLETASRVILENRDQYTAAETRVRDADLALESTRLARLQILQQAGIAVLAQTNLSPQIALQLLRS